MTLFHYRHRPSSWKLTHVFENKGSLHWTCHWISMVLKKDQFWMLVVSSARIVNKHTHCLCITFTPRICIIYSRLSLSSPNIIGCCSPAVIWSSFVFIDDFIEATSWAKVMFPTLVDLVSSNDTYILLSDCHVRSYFLIERTVEAIIRSKKAFSEPTYYLSSAIYQTWSYKLFGQACSPFGRPSFPSVDISKHNYGMHRVSRPRHRSVKATAIMCLLPRLGRGTDLIQIQIFIA